MHLKATLRNLLTWLIVSPNIVKTRYDECLLTPLLYARHCWAASLVTSHLPTQLTIYKSLLPHSAAIPHTNTSFIQMQINFWNIYVDIYNICTLHTLHSTPTFSISIRRRCTIVVEYKPFWNLESLLLYLSWSTSWIIICKEQRGGRISVTVLVMVMLNHSDQGGAAGGWWRVPLGNCSLVSLVNWRCLAPAVTAAT